MASKPKWSYLCCYLRYFYIYCYIGYVGCEGCVVRGGKEEERRGVEKGEENVMIILSKVTKERHIVTFLFLSF